MGADSFMWGSATAAYQCEGAWQDGEKIPPTGMPFATTR